MYMTLRNQYRNLNSAPDSYSAEHVDRVAPTESPKMLALIIIIIIEFIYSHNFAIHCVVFALCPSPFRIKTQRDKAHFTLQADFKWSVCILIYEVTKIRKLSSK